MVESSKFNQDEQVHLDNPDINWRIYVKIRLKELN